MRKWMAGVVGGFVMFIWGALAHMVLPLGEAGIRSMPNEELVLGAMKQAIPEAGLYMFPGMDQTGTPEEQKAWEAKYAAGPVGIVVYDPVGGNVLSPRQLILELLTDIAAAFLVGLFISSIGGSLARRAAMGAGLGFFAWLTISASHWIWYRFPATFSLAEGTDQVVGWALAALAMTAIAKPGRRGAESQSVVTPGR